MIVSIEYLKKTSIPYCKHVSKSQLYPQGVTLIEIVDTKTRGQIYCHV